MTADARKPRLARALPLLLAILTGSFFIIRAWHGIGFLPFVDEAEHLLGGKMLNAGAVLYRDFVSQHGPVTFMLTQAYGALFGWKHPNSARWLSVLLAAGATACVAGSPSLPTRTARYWAASLFLGLVTTIWLVQAIYLVNYHTIAGFLLAGSLPLFVAPLWLGARINPSRAAASGAGLVLMTATAYSFGPPMVLLGISVLWAATRTEQRQAAWAFSAGALVAGLLVAAWMLKYGDFRGYFAFHFAENQFVFSHFTRFTLEYFVSSQIPSLAADTRVHALGLFCWVASFMLILSLNFRRIRPSHSMAGPILLGIVGMLAQTARGGTGFSDGSFLIGNMALLAIALPTLITRTLPASSPWILSCGTALIAALISTAEFSNRQAFYSPFHLTRTEVITQHSAFHSLGKAGDPISLRIRALTRPDETILAVPYSPNIYLYADRPPMRRYFYYLPWDAEYAKTPYFGETHDICEDLPKAPPVAIFYDKWVVWFQWELATYKPCFVTYLTANYTQQKDLPNLYIRNDRQAQQHP